MAERLPAHLEVSGLIRCAEAEGGFAAVIAKGDRDSGSIILLIASRGVHFACLERGLGPSGGYDWRKAGPGAGAQPAELSEWCAKRRAFDPDSWLIELDIPSAERFIAETTSIS